MGLRIKDKVTPELRRAMRGLSDTKPVMEAAGLTLVGITKRAFSDAALRAAPWRPRKDKQPHNLLRKSGNLWQSITITALTKTLVTIGSNAIYAAIQQLGSRKSTGRGSGIPARPFFPFTPAGKPTPYAAQRIGEVVRAKIASILRGGSRP